MNSKYIRYIFGFLFLILILISFSNKLALYCVSLVFIVFAISEYRNMFKNKEIQIISFLPEIFGAVCSYIFIFNKEQFLIPFLISSIIAIFCITVVTNKKPYMLTSFGTILSVFFIICGLYIIYLYEFFAANGQSLCIIIYFLSVLTGDFFASQVGQKVKPLYITPEISPNKTLAGSIANYIATLIVCSLFKIFLNFSILNCIIISIAISTFSQFGDLALSTIKRDLNIKHSGNYFADYGGIWDRIDSFLFSAPALYYLLVLIS